MHEAFTLTSLFFLTMWRLIFVLDGMFSENIRIILQIHLLKNQRQMSEIGRPFQIGKKIHWLDKPSVFHFQSSPIFFVPVEPVGNSLRFLISVMGAHHHPVVSCDAPECFIKLLPLLVVKQKNPKFFNPESPSVPLFVLLLKAKIPPHSDKTAPTAAFTLVSVAASTTAVAFLRLCLPLYI